MKKFLEKYNFSNGVKNVAKISGGTMAGQLLSFITLPIYTRIYGATVIGNWALFTSIATIVNSFSDLGLSNAIMIENSEEDSLRVYKVISTIVLITSLITGFFSYIYYSIKPEETGISTWFIALTLTVLIITSQQSQVCYTLLNRKGAYDILMKNPVVNQVLIAVIAIPLGFLGVQKYGYYIGLIAGQLGMIVHMKRFLPREMFTFKKKDFEVILKRHVTFWKYQLPTNLVSNVKNQLPTLMIKALFGSEMLGYYSVSVRILNIPINLLANAIGRVYFHTASLKIRNGEPIGNYTYQNIVKAIKVALIPIIGMMAFGDLALTIFLGEGYEIAGQMFRIVVLQNFFMFLMIATQGITAILKKQKYAMVSCILQSIGYAVGLAAGAYIFNSVYIGLILMSVAYIIIQIVYFCVLFKAMETSWVLYLRSVVVSMAILLVSTFSLRGIMLLLGIIHSI